MQFDDVTVIQNEVSGNHSSIDFPLTPDLGEFEIFLEIPMDCSSQFQNGTAACQDEWISPFDLPPGRFGEYANQSQELKNPLSEVSDSLVLAQKQEHYPITKAIYSLFSSLGEGPFLAAALGVWCMIFLAVTVIGASLILGKKLGALFRV